MAGIKRKAESKGEITTKVKKAKPSADSARSFKPAQKPTKSKPVPVREPESDLDESDTTEDENDGFGFSANIEAEEDGFKSEKEVDVKPKKLTKTNGAVQEEDATTSEGAKENPQETGEKANVLQDKLGGTRLPESVLLPRLMLRSIILPRSTREAEDACPRTQGRETKRRFRPAYQTTMGAPEEEVACTEGGEAQTRRRAVWHHHRAGKRICLEARCYKSHTNSAEVREARPADHDSKRAEGRVQDFG